MRIIFKNFFLGTLVAQKKAAPASLDGGPERLFCVGIRFGRGLEYAADEAEVEDGPDGDLADGLEEVALAAEVGVLGQFGVAHPQKERNV